MRIRVENKEFATLIARAFACGENGMADKVLVILIDGCKPNYVNLDEMSFLSALKSQNLYSRLDTILGYSNAIRATAFTGTYPSTHGKWCNYVYNPERSPFHNLEYLEFVDHIPSDFFRRFARFFLSKTLMKKVALENGYQSLSLGSVPIPLLRYFDYTEIGATSVGSPRIPSLFDILSKSELRYQYFSFSYFNTRNHMRIFEKYIRDISVAFVYLPHLDAWAHWFGISSDTFRKKVVFVDKVVAQLFAIAESIWGVEFSFLIFSDHGMCDVKDHIDFFQLSKNWNARIGTDYIPFLDATMARFWYKDSGTKDEIRRGMTASYQGHFLSPPELSDYGLKFESNKYGDDIFLLDPGYVFFPNFLSWVKPKAMHGYNPSHKSQQAFVIVGSNNISKKSLRSARMVDIMPTLLNILEVSAPPSCEGRILP